MFIVTVRGVAVVYMYNFNMKILDGNDWKEHTVSNPM